jgi:hypothetical protein
MNPPEQEAKSAKLAGQGNSRTPRKDKLNDRRQPKGAEIYILYAHAGTGSVLTELQLA